VGPKVHSLSQVGFAFVLLLAGANQSSAEESDKTLLGKRDQEWALQQIVLFNLMAIETPRGKCEKQKLKSARVSVPPAPGRKKLGGRLLNADWTERWRVDECGVRWEYSLKFTTNKRGDLEAQITPRGGGPGTIVCKLPNGKQFLISTTECSKAGGTTVPE
jgi:hypothetical protein